MNMKCNMPPFIGNIRAARRRESLSIVARPAGCSKGQERRSYIGRGWVQSFVVSFVIFISGSADGRAREREREGALRKP